MIIRATQELDGNDYVEVRFPDDVDIHEVKEELKKLLYGMGYCHESIMEILPEEE